MGGSLPVTMIPLCRLIKIERVTDGHAVGIQGGLTPLGAMLQSLDIGYFNHGIKRTIAV